MFLRELEDLIYPGCPCKTPLKYIFKTILTIAYLAVLMIIWLSCIPALVIKENNILQHGGKHETKGHEQVAINGLKVRHTGHSTADASYLQQKTNSHIINSESGGCLIGRGKIDAQGNAMGARECNGRTGMQLLYKRCNGSTRIR